MPSVSILIPTYEPTPEHLRAAIDSVLAQTFEDWELIVHDDASKTDVQAIVRPYLKDPRILFRQSPHRLGIGGNWNASIRQTTAPLVAYLFQDDLWEPAYLERSMEVFAKNPDVGFTAADHAYRIESRTGAAATGIYKEVEDLRKTEMPPGRLLKEEFLTRWITRGLRPNLIGEPSFVMLRRALIQAVGPFREDMKQGLDAEYWVRCLLKSDGFWLTGTLGTFRVHPKAATAANEDSGAGSLDRLKIFRMLIRALPPGPLRRLAKKSRRRQVVDLGKKAMIRKTRNPHIRFLRYLIVGGSASVVDFGVYALLSSGLGVNYYAAAFAGYTTGFVLNHLLCVYWIFESKMSRSKEVALSYSIALGGLAWTELFLWLFVSALHIHHLIARFATMWIVLVWNYGMRKVFVFR